MPRDYPEEPFDWENEPCGTCLHPHIDHACDDDYGFDCDLATGNQKHGPCSVEGCTCTSYVHYPRVEASCLKHREVYEAQFDSCGACQIEELEAEKQLWESRQVTPEELAQLESITRVVLQSCGLWGIDDPLAWRDEKSIAKAQANLDTSY